MTSSASIVPLYFRYSTIKHDASCYGSFTAVHVAFIITEPHLTFNWPLKYTGEMELRREGVEVSIDPILVTPICLPVNRTPLLYTSLKNQPYEGLHSGSHCSPCLQGPCQSAHVLYILVYPGTCHYQCRMIDCAFWVANEGFVEAVLEKYWSDVCCCCYSENKFSKQTRSVLLIPTTIRTPAYLA